MMLLLAVLLGTAQSAGSGYDLPERYWLNPVNDTFIDSARANENFGREPSLVLGPGKAILINFPQTRWAGLDGRRVESAELVLVFSRPAANLGLSVSMLKNPWGEGGGRSLRFDRPDPSVTPWGGATWKHAIQGPGGVSWQTDGAAGASDATALEGIDAVAEGRNLKITGLGPAVQAMIDRPDQNHGLRIESPADVAFFSGEFTAERPQLNITFAQPESEPVGSDLIALSLTPPSGAKNGNPGEYTLLIKNIGAAEASGGRVEWTDPAGTRTSIDLPSSIAAGQTATVRLPATYREEPTDPRRFTASALIVQDGDINPGNNSIRAYSGGLKVAFEADASTLEQIREISPFREPMILFRHTVEKFNHYVLPHSRFIGNPDGIHERLNLVADVSEADIRVDLSGLGKPSAIDLEFLLARSLVSIDPAVVTPPEGVEVPWDNRRHALGWFPDTRDDGLRIPGLELPLFGFASDTSSVPLFANGLISRQEAFAINRNIGKRGDARQFPWDIMEQGLLIRAVGLTGNLLDKTAIGIFKPGSSQPIAVGDTGGTGMVYFGPSQLPEPLFTEITRMPQNAWLRIEATNGLDSASAWLPAYQALDWFVRGNRGLMSVELRFPIATKGADRTQDLAANKVVADSSGRYPAELTPLVDGNVETAVDLFPSQWVEIDLARDRTIGLVEIHVGGGSLDQFDILFYGTSQTAESASRWASVNDGNTILNTYGKGLFLPIAAPARSARYVRIVNRGKEKATLTGIHIYPAKGN